MRLDAGTALPTFVEDPGYGRASLKPGIVHLGIGTFHRAHQAVYTDAALSRRFGDWGIVGVSLRSTAIVENHFRQDGRFAVVTKSPGGGAARVVGCVVEGLAATQEREPGRLRGETPSW